ncbi:MAG TPA: hypothetical protein VG099_21405 [Gemmataceae bacterium]|jgi:hypothetical protein|nr:hypothetical protein [Gemmataceae bacterium]
MPDFPIDFRSQDYKTEHGQILRPKRGYVLCQFPGVPFLCDAFFDSAAPFSIIPYTLSKHLAWTPVAAQLTKVGKTAASALTWQGIPCELGAIVFRLIHLSTGLQSGMLRMLAKLPKRATISALEHTVILGLSVVEENPIRFVIDSSTGALSGYFSVP